jgi:hypothetical protein
MGPGNNKKKSRGEVAHGHQETLWLRPWQRRVSRNLIAEPWQKRNFVAQTLAHKGFRATGLPETYALTSAPQGFQNPPLPRLSHKGSKPSSAKA